ncbi:hypothetical protein DPMN_139477 [Dreissena polymorpha]|uniref:C3H1-type domain-containing protein n=1 Tax=Dreissena polymorpha TaxID=45954 RepID=A0A9D4G5T6_DREPO|nr:hypothetical protein DPMN_139477 [Dreissena polymorpha]
MAGVSPTYSGAAKDTGREDQYRSCSSESDSNESDRASSSSSDEDNTGWFRYEERQVTSTHTNKVEDGSSRFVVGPISSSSSERWGSFRHEKNEVRCSSSERDRIWRLYCEEGEILASSPVIYRKESAGRDEGRGRSSSSEIDECRSSIFERYEHECASFEGDRLRKKSRSRDSYARSYRAMDGNDSKSPESLGSFSPENVRPNECTPRTEERSKRSKSKYQTSARSSAPGNNNMPLYIINLKICQLYIQDTTHTHKCNDLHICKFFLIALCKLEKECPFSHNLRERHNYKVLKSKKIHTLPDSDVLNLCRNLFNRNWTTLPIVCKFYNNEGNCKYRNCQHLHVCKYYVDGKCKFDQRCKRNHSLGSDKQTRKVFENYGIDTIRIAEEKLMTALRDAVDKRRVYEDETAGPRRRNRQQKH